MIRTVTAGTVLVISADRTWTSGQPINLGDALLTQALCEALRGRGFDARIADFGPKRASDSHHVRLHGIRGLVGQIRSSDAVVIGGGTLVQDDAKSGPPWRGFPRLLLVSVLISRVLRKKVAFFGVGSNPVKRAVPRQMLRIALWRTPVWVRDELTEGLLRSQWGKRSRVAADTALLAQFDTPDEASSDAPGPLVVAAYAAEIATLTESYLAQLREQFGALEFVSMHQGSGADAEAIPANLMPYFRAVHRDISLATAVSLFGGSSAVLSSRMHALYLALLLDKPMVSMSHRFKVASFRREFGVPLSEPGGPDADGRWSIEPLRADSEAVVAARGRLEDALDELVALFDPSTGRNSRAAEASRE